MSTITRLPRYPSVRARSALAPSQRASLHKTVAGALAQALALPPGMAVAAGAQGFLETYLRDRAQVALGELVWAGSENAKGGGRGGGGGESKIEQTIHRRALRLAGALAAAPPGLPLQTLVDLCIVYGPTSPKRTRAVLAAAGPVLARQAEAEAVPAFAALLERAETEGLYALRRLSHVLLCVLRAAPREVARPFARSRPFVAALTRAYGEGLAGIARAYGGVARLVSAAGGTESQVELDEWERVWLETKAALLDCFGVVVRTLLQDAADAQADTGAGGTQLADRSDAVFGLVSALLEMERADGGEGAGHTPFVDASLLADYQRTYDLAALIARVEDGARAVWAQTALGALNNGDGQRVGVLRLLIRSSGAPPGMDRRGRGPGRDVTTKGKDKGKGKARAVSADLESPPDRGRESDAALDAAVAQVLDVLPEQPLDYVRFVLGHPDYPYRGDAERLIGALLEGTAPGVEEVEAAMTMPAEGGGSDGIDAHKESGEYVFTSERRNVFDSEDMDLSKVRIGKKQDDAAALMRDRASIEQMKADILRRAEEMENSDEEEEEEDAYAAGGKGKAKAKARGVDVAFEDELDEAGAVRVRDGEPSDDEGESDSEGEENEEGDGEGQESAPKSPETLLELAYLRDPKLFDRDAQTRRSSARAGLKAQTGWSDEQIEGWRIMLERNPKKDKILQKHEFAGNRPGVVANEPGPSSQPSAPRGGRGGRGARGHGRGRGGGGGRGRGGGQAGAGAGTEGATARDRAWKDKNKASRGNHNRKRGHDKKMARVGGPD